VHGAAAALALVDELDLDNYHAFHATRADLLSSAGPHQRSSGRLRARGRHGADRC
jgi:RNA polymerase sigma-70 factor (ECF subfamily)